MLQWWWILYIYILDIHNEKTDYIFENIFSLMSLSIHSLFTIKIATKIISYNKLVIIIVGNKWIKTKRKQYNNLHQAMETILTYSLKVTRDTKIS